MKNNKKGISLIVLVITIIVIIILAAAVILTLNNNNPIAEANDARYSSDVANMQAILTNTIAKIMAANQTTISITKATTIPDTALTTQIDYTLDHPTNKANSAGVITFEAISGTNPGTTTNEAGDTVDHWKTGKALPDYKAGTESWIVDTEGTLTLTVRAGTEKAKTYPASGVVDDTNAGTNP